MPKQAPLPERDYLPLNSGAVVYGTADVAALRPALDAVELPALSGTYAAQMLDRSEKAAFAVFANGSGSGGKAAIQLATVGSYPAFRANFSLTFTKGWKKYRAEGRPYWYQAAEGLSLAVTNSEAFVYLQPAPAVGATPVPPFVTPESAPETPPGQTLPEGFAAFANGGGTALALWVAEPQSRINSFFQKLGLPIQAPAQACFAAVDAVPGGGEAEPQYQGRIRLTTFQPSQARALAMLFTLAQRFLPALEGSGGTAAGMASLFLANPPVLDGSNGDGASIDIETPPLTASALALLLRGFLLF